MRIPKAQEQSLRRGLSVWMGGLVLLVVSIAVPCLAQLSTGTILGVIFDPSGAVIPDATVVVQNQGTGQTWKLATSAKGVFIAPELAVGAYSVSISHAGFQTVVRRNVAVSVSSRVQLAITLKPGATRQTVTVTSGAPVIDTASTTLGRVVGEREIRDLPTNGRDLSQLLELVPGVNLQGGEGSIAGQSMFAGAGDAIHYLMDGTDASRVDYNFIDNTYGSSQNRITRASIDDVQEFRVYENSFSAEYGDALGGVVNIVTKSGTNQFHGDVYEFFRNEVLDARGYFDPAPQIKPPFRLNQFGGSVGGPIIHDKLFFFANDETIRQRTGTSLLGYVPTAAFRQTAVPAVQPAVNMLPLPNGPVSTTNPNLSLYSAQKSNLLNESAPAVKINYLLSPTKRLDFRYNADDSLTENYFGIATGQIAPSYGLNQSSQLSFTDTLSPTWLNVARVAFNRVHIDPRDSIDPAIRNFPDVSITGMAGVGPGLFDLQVANNSFTYLDNATHVAGNHQLKFGTQIVRNQDNKALNFEEMESYTSVANFMQNRPQSVSTLGQPRAGMRNTYFNFYVQDDIQATKDLAINAGVRYQYGTSPSEAHGRAVNFDPITGRIDPTYSQVLNAPGLDFAPRFGFAYAPFRSRHTVLRASFGIFFPDVEAGMAQNFPSNIYQQATSINNLQDPTLQGFPFPAITQFSAVTGLSAIQQDWKSPYLEAWNFTIQQQLGENSRLQIAYVGNHGVHLISPTENINRYFVGTTIRPYPAWGTIGVTMPRAESSYNALQVSFNHRFAHGLTFNANYTYAHALDDEPGGIFGGYQDDHNPMLDYGNSDIDVRHQLEFDYVYALPSVPHVPHVLGGGWQVNGITNIRSGLPYSVSCNCDPFGYGANTAYADTVPGVSRRPANYNLPANQLNAAAYIAPQKFTWGNSGRNSVYGPSAFNFDFSLFKNFRVREHLTLQFQAETFNIFNTPQFNNPLATLGGTGFGESFGTLGTLDGFGTNRQVQFALQLMF